MNSPAAISSERSTAYILLLLVVTLIAMSPVCRNEFIEWDDPQTIASNPNFNPPSLQGLVNHWTSPHQALYVPVTYTVWWGLAQVAQTSPSEGMSLNPWIYHTANLLIHVGSTFAAFAILKRLEFPAIAAFFGAAIFGVHPLQVEAVAWASGTKDVLGGLLSLLAILCYLKQPRDVRRNIASIGIFILAFLAKPGAVVVPVMLVLIRWLWQGETFKAALRELWVWFVFTIPMIILTATVQPTIHAVVAPLWARPLMAMDALAFYLYKLVAPIHLALDYGRTPSRIIQTGAIWWTWIVPVIVLVISFAGFGKRGAAVCLLFVAGMMPVLGLVNFTFQSYSTVADHYLYLPMLATAVAVATLSGQMRGSALIVVPVVVVCSVLSFMQANTWHDTRSTFTQVLKVNDRSAVAYSNLATIDIREKNDEEAKPRLERAIELDPNFGPARMNLAMLHLRLGEKDLARVQFEELLRIYRSQKNADPKLTAAVEQMVKRLTK